MRTIVILAVLLPAAVVVAGPASQPAGKPAKIKITLGRDTTYVTDAPLNADGTVNYVAYLNKRLSKGVTPKNNAFVALLDVFGPEWILRASRKETYRLLGVEPPDKGNFFIGYDEFRDTPKGKGATDEMRDKAMAEPWTPEKYKPVAVWLATNAASLDKAVAAAKLPHYYVPLVARRDPPALFESCDFYSFSGLRALARAMIARAMLRAGEGKLEAAWSDLMAVRRLARLKCREGTLISYLQALGTDSVALRAAAELPKTGKLRASEAALFTRSLQELPPLPSLRTLYDETERLHQLDMIMMIARGGDVLGELKLRPDVLEQVDWDEVLRAANLWFDEYVLYDESLPYPEQMEVFADKVAHIEKLGKEANQITRQKLDAIEQEFAAAGPKRRKEITHRMVGMLLAFSAPPIGEQLYELQQRGRVQRDIALIQIALAWYKAERKTYPKTLDVLKPKYLARIPLDRFTDKPLVYRIEGDGYVLYSVGANGKDDGGVWDGKERDDVAVPVRWVSEEGTGSGE